MEQPLIVQAKYSFRGNNNDELCFKKGDVITVTQREEGGWWEGTLGDKTGWFPSNYVKEYKSSLPTTETIRPPEEVQEYRSLVLNDLLESERAHVVEIQGLLTNFLGPLQTSQILTIDEYSQLICNFPEVVQTHEELLQGLEKCNDRFGKLFLTKAPIMKNVHQAYCAAHPKAIVILDKYKDELEAFMEQQGAASPGLLVLTTGLSKPFRRLDKYSAMLQELERHMENSHSDRGDTQRSVSVYKDIATTCSATRRQKELELQVLTGPVRGWQGQELSTLGDIVHMGSVAVGIDHRDRYFVLFPQTLLILSVSQRMSAFIYEGKLPLTGIVVNRLEDTDNIKNAFEISGLLIEKIIAICQGPNEANKWVELLSSTNLSHPTNIKRNVSSSVITSSLQSPSQMSPPLNLGINHLNRGTPTVHQPSQHRRSLSFNHHLSYNQYQTYHHQQQQNLQDIAVTQQNQNINLVEKVVVSNHLLPLSGNTKANWSITNLCPAPPLRTNLLTYNCGTSNGITNPAVILPYSNRKTQPTYEEDALVLRVIEAYCAAYQSNVRNTINSALQPWTPCLPIRSGKLKTSKHFSTSNPQLPFICSTSSVVNINTGAKNSTSSLNSSHIWREARPNNFNMYSASVSSLNTAYRYSLGGGTNSVTYVGISTVEYRSMSEERALRKKYNSATKSTTLSSSLAHQQYQNQNPHQRFKIGSGYDKLFMVPLLPRKSKQTKMFKTTYQTVQRSSSPTKISCKNVNMPNNTICKTSANESTPPPGLYDRRLNRSFELSQGLKKVSSLRHSTPHLASEEIIKDIDSQQFSATWCCGNFVMKQWRKLNNYN